MIKVKIHSDYYDMNEKLFNFPRDICTIRRGVTYLVGCNGSGKSTILGAINNKYRWDEDPNLVFIEIDERDGGNRTLMNKSLYNGNMDLLSSMAVSSEGERIKIYLGTKISGLAKKLKDNPNVKLVITIDSIDSGLSIDNIEEIKELIEDTIMKDAPKDTHIIISANTFTFVKDSICLDVSTNTYHKFKTYDEYAEFIRKSSEYKKNRSNE